MDTLWRLAWALPLVLTIGIAAVLILRRFVMRPQSTTAPTQRICMRDSLQLSEDTRVYLIEIDGKPHLIVESARPGVLQSALLQAGEVPYASIRFAPPWMQRWYRGARR